MYRRHYYRVLFHARMHYSSEHWDPFLQDMKNTEEINTEISLSDVTTLAEMHLDADNTSVTDNAKKHLDNITRGLWHELHSTRANMRRTTVSKAEQAWFLACPSTTSKLYYKRLRGKIKMILPAISCQHSEYEKHCSANQNIFIHTTSHFLT